MQSEVGALTETGMRDAVVAHLVQRPVPGQATDQAGRTDWSSSIRYGGGPGADPATIEFVKSKSFSTCQLHSVSYLNHRGWTMPTSSRPGRNRQVSGGCTSLVEGRDQIHVGVDLG